MTTVARVQRETAAHRALALDAARQAESVLALFEREHPDDGRPRAAIEAIRAWAEGRQTLDLAEVRSLSLASHAAARSASTDVARFAARAAGQAIAAWHVPAHANAVTSYVAKTRAAAEATKA